MTRSLARIVGTLALAGVLAPSGAAGADCLVAGADCTLRETAAQRGFHVGSAEAPLGSSPEFDAALAGEFNSLTTENALKWGPLSSAPGSYDFARADAAVEFAEANGMRVRGHTLFWHRLNGPPAWLEGELAAAADPQARLRELMAEHVDTVMGRYAGRVTVWDVVNEPFHEFLGQPDPDDIFFQTLGIDYVAEAFALARRADSSAELFLNETTLELFDAKFEAFRDLVSGLLDDGVPIDGVGLQAHFFAVPELASLQAKIQAFADLGLAVELTELDIPIWLFQDDPDPLAAQADAYADVFAACLRVSACRGITVWGVDDGHTWLDDFVPDRAPNRPLLLDEDLVRKPAWRAAREALALVPEPSTALLLGAGLLALAVRRRSAR